MDVLYYDKPKAGGGRSILSIVDIPTDVTTFLRANEPHLPSNEIMDPFTSTSQSPVSGILRNVPLNISLLNLTETFLFSLSVGHTRIMLLLEHLP